MSRWSDAIVFDVLPTYKENAMGDIIEIPGTLRTVYANKKAIRQSEFYQAHAIGLKPNLAFEVRSTEYQDEEHLKYDDKRYRIIRTYDKGEIIELICEGVVNHGTT